MVDSPLDTVGMKFPLYILEEHQRYLAKECISSTPQRRILEADAMKARGYAGLVDNIPDGAAVDTRSKTNRETKCACCRMPDAVHGLKNIRNQLLGYHSKKRDIQRPILRRNGGENCIKIIIVHSVSSTRVTWQEV